MSDNYHNYQLLLAKAARLYEKYDAGYPDPFNVFSVLHKETDEVNLHSRFLHALINYQKPGTDTRENLKDFLHHVGVKDFELCDVKVERERYHIDILITNDKRQAIIIENKIEAGDQPKQLQRYSEILEEQGYSDRDIHLLYLTLDGHDPSEDSAGDLDYKTISYRDDLSSWLEHCQKRAYDEPELRESVIQYLRLVRKLTRTDPRGKYMNALKELCLKDENFVFIHDLKNAMLEAVSDLRRKLWNEIHSELELLESEIPEFRQLLTDKSDTKRYYKLSEASSLEIGEEEGRIWFGVGCSEEEYRDPYVMLERGLNHLSGEKNKWYPWYRYTDKNLNLCDPTPENLKLLLSTKKRKEFARQFVQDVKEVLEVLEDIALVNAIKEGEKTGLASREEVFKILKGIEC